MSAFIEGIERRSKNFQHLPAGRKNFYEAVPKPHASDGERASRGRFLPKNNMKLISLNIWGGKAYEPLMKFIKDAAPTTDVFCFQEVFSSSSGIKISRGAHVNIFGDLKTLLPDFKFYFAANQDGFDLEGHVDFPISIGDAIFAKKEIIIDESGNFFAAGEKNSATNQFNIPAVVQFIRLRLNGKKLTVCNFHGIAEPGDKLDNPQRLAQSEKIRKFLDGETGAKILCGDFNLLPDTESVTMLEKNLINLVKKFNIGRTRSNLSPFFGSPEFQKFADYTLVSQNIEVKNFSAPDVTVSDHLPMVLEFELSA
jgi:exonuclease III